MIELITDKYSDELMLMITRLLAWLVDEVHKQINSDLDGYTVIRDDAHTEMFVLLICDDKHHERLLDILKQPPEPFRGRYIARVVNMETIPEDKKEKNEEEETNKG